jgi:hypothetical protein
MSDFHINQMMFLDDVVEGEWELNPKGEVIVKGDVDMSYLNLSDIPYKFKYISGYFNCSNNQLTTLKNAPKEIGGGFNGDSNNLKNIKYLPKCIRYLKEDIYSNYSFRANPLTTLEHIPKNIKDGCIYFSWSDEMYEYFKCNLDKIHFWGSIHSYLDILVNVPESINYIKNYIDRDDLIYYLNSIPQTKLYYKG